MCRGVKKMYDSLNAISLRHEGVSWFHFIVLYFAIGEGGAGVMDKVSMAGHQAITKWGQKARANHSNRNKEWIQKHFKGSTLAPKQFFPFPFLLIPFH
jgi:hypothetical protein